jgi:hypothetical protein
MCTRRSFLASAGGTLAALSLRAQERVHPEEEVPASLDHVLLGCADLDQGIAFVEARTGVRAAMGGTHPGRGTRNALLSFGDRHYLEVIAPDPAQPGATDPRSKSLKMLSAPRIVGWAAHPGDLPAMAARLQEGGIAFEGPTAGARRRPDGRELHWATLSLEDNSDNLLPFFIEWSAGSVHPSADAPRGCRLVRFALVTPEPDALARKAAALSLEVAVTRGDQPGFLALIAGPKGELALDP